MRQDFFGFCASRFGVARPKCYHGKGKLMALSDSVADAPWFALTTRLRHEKTVATGLEVTQRGRLFAPLSV